MKELFLDTNGTCFLCLKDMDNNVKEKSKKKEVCLRSLCRFLKISPWLVLRRGLEGSLEKDEGHEEDAGGVDQCEFSVTLCTTCAFVVEELDALKRQQEIVRILMEHHVKVLNQILEVSDENNISESSRWSKLHEKMRRNNEDPVEARLVEQLRNEAKQKCALKIKEVQKTTIPKVSIERILSSPRRTKPSHPVIQVENDESDSSDFESPPVLSPQISLESCHQNKDTVMSPKRFTFPPQLPVESYPESTMTMSPKNLLKTVLKTPCRKEGECPFCRKMISAGRYFRTHLLNVHSERFLTSIKPPTMSELEFQNLCRHLLLMETKRAGTGLIKFTPLKKDKVLSCLYCGKICHGGFRLREHLVLDHYQLLKAKLSSVKVKSTQRIYRHKSNIKIVRSSKVKSAAWICDFERGGCGHTFSTSGQLNLHKNEANQISTYFMSCYGGDNGINCKLQFASKCGLFRHQRESGHRNGFRRWTCNLGNGGCGKSFKLKHHLDRHITKNCPKRKTNLAVIRGTSKAKIKTLQSCQKISCGSCGGRRFISKQTLQRPMKEIHGKDAVKNSEPFEDNKDLTDQPLNLRISEASSRCSQVGNSEVSSHLISSPKSKLELVCDIYI